MVTSDFIPEVEIRPFRACAMHPAIIIETVRSQWPWLWDRYHVPQNVFLVHNTIQPSDGCFTYVCLGVPRILVTSSDSRALTSAELADGSELQQSRVERMHGMACMFSPYVDSIDRSITPMISGKSAGACHVTYHVGHLYSPKW